MSQKNGYRVFSENRNVYSVDVIDKIKIVYMSSYILCRSREFNLVCVFVIYYKQSNKNKIFVNIKNSIR